ncbi:MAG: FliH/SctL family protein [Deltaproteobacteria bacterium]|nr:FliH/SctL family protein [Deltaproteobacteria bacterium]MCX7953144.1 FliH/SctL family protein [Deltaproteobacteria bacterium]
MQTFEPDAFYKIDETHAFISNATDESLDEFEPSYSPKSIVNETNEYEQKIRELEEKLAVLEEESFKNGYEKARLEFDEKLGQVKAELGEKFKIIVEDLENQISLFFEDLEKKMVMASIELCEKLLLQAIQFRPDYILQFIQRALDFKRQVRVTKIRLSQDDYEIAQLLNIQKASSVGSIQFIADETIKAGCIVETTAGEISMLPFEKLKDLKEEIFS